MNKLRQFMQLTGRERLRVGEAVGWLLLARWALQILPFPWLKGWMEYPGPNHHLEEHERQAICVSMAEAVDYAVHRLAIEAVCFPRALAVHAMLRRRGIPTTLYYGVERYKIASQPRTPHVWLQDGPNGVIGQPKDETQEMVVLACFPPKDKKGKPVMPILFHMPGSCYEHPSRFPSTTNTQRIGSSSHAPCQTGLEQTPL